MKRLFSLLLAVLFVLSLCLLTACGDEPAQTTQRSETTATQKNENPAVPSESNGTGTSTSGSTVASSATTASTQDTTATTDPTELDGRAKHPDFLDVNFGGKAFVFATQDIDDWDTFEIYAEATGNDTLITEAVIARNTVLESLYNCTIREVSGENTYQLIEDDVATGSYNYDFCKYQYLNTKVSGAWLNIAALDLDLGHEWWDQSFIETFGATVDGSQKLYSISGSFDLIACEALWCLFFNKNYFDQLTQSGKIDIDLYQCVRSGDWTLDVMTELIDAASADTNGDSAMDYSKGDIFGFSTIANNYASYAFYFGVGGKGAVSVNGLPTAATGDNIDVEMMTQAIDKARAIYTSQNTCQLSQEDVRSSLDNGQALFISECLGAAADHQAAENSRISIVPFPKYNKAQDRYYSYVCDRQYGLKVSAAVTDRNAIADFLEVFGFHSMLLLYPEYIRYYGTQIFCEEESGEMFSLALSSRVYDLDYFLKGGIVGSASGMISGSTKNNFSRALAGKAATCNTVLGEYVTTLKTASH